MSDRDLPKINVHVHLRAEQDIGARIRLWREWNVVHAWCQCCSDHMGAALGRALTTKDFPALRQQHGEILVGFAGVNLTHEKIDTPADIERYRDMGFVGLKCICNSFPYSDERYFPVYEKADELGMPILFHAGFLAVITPEFNRRFRIASKNMRAFHLEAIARCFPNLKIIAAHLGGPHYCEALKLVEAFPNAYADLSGGSGKPVHVRKILGALLPHPGLETDMTDPAQNRALAWFEKFCFATDNPEPDIWVPNSERIMDRLEIPSATRKAFHYDNAAKLLPAT